jgi:hypothetical protein
MKIAVQGCAHGDLDDIYASVRHIEETENVKVDLLISCGDFQAVRNESDLDSMAVPQKYKQLGCFHKYYSGEVEAPYPTLFSKSEDPTFLSLFPTNSLTDSVSPNNKQLEVTMKLRTICGSSTMAATWHRRCFSWVTLV